MKMNGENMKKERKERHKIVMAWNINFALTGFILIVIHFVFFKARKLILVI
jgi:hypothetical protein